MRWALSPTLQTLTYRGGLCASAQFPADDDCPHPMGGEFISISEIWVESWAQNECGECVPKYSRDRISQFVASFQTSILLK